MTLERIAAFAKSPNGQLYAGICREWGRDPAEGISDPFMAMQLRAALLWREPVEASGEVIAEEHRARVEAAREAAARLKR